MSNKKIKYPFLYAAIGLLTTVVVVGFSYLGWLLIK